MGKRSPRAVYSFFSSHHVNSDIFFQFFHRERYFTDFLRPVKRNHPLYPISHFLSDFFRALFLREKKIGKNKRFSYRLIRTKNMSLVSPDKFQHILRVQNTNIDGKFKFLSHENSCFFFIPKL